MGSKVKITFTLQQAMEARGRGEVQLYSFFDLGTGKGGLSLCNREKGSVSIVQEAGWAPGPVRTGAENLAPTRILCTDRPAHSMLLYRLSYPDPSEWTVCCKSEVACRNVWDLFYKSVNCVTLNCYEELRTNFFSLSVSKFQNTKGSYSHSCAGFCLFVWTNTFLYQKTLGLFESSQNRGWLSSFSLSFCLFTEALNSCWQYWSFARSTASISFV
jgi:hypothetical protein